MAKFINDPINNAQVKAERGKIKIKKKKLKTDIAKEASPEHSQILNDNTSKTERDKICKEARADHNPATGAHSYVADVKRKITQQINKDLGNS